jgi:hypothetical protein
MLEKLFPNNDVKEEDVLFFANILLFVASIIYKIRYQTFPIVEFIIVYTSYQFYIKHYKKNVIYLSLTAISIVIITLLPY